MTTRLNALILAASISLVLMLAPGTAAPQDRKEPASEPPQNAAEPAQQQPAPSNGPAAVSREPQAAMPAEAASAEEEAPPAKEQFSEHTIKQGDTLWDIANLYLRDPFLWPFIWKANPSIANPDLIYAGNKLAIPSLGPIERAMQATPGTQVVEKQAPVKEAAPKPAPQKPAVEPVQEESKPVEGIAAARALRPKPVVPEETAPAPGNRLILPEEQQQPIIDKYAMLSAGFVNELEVDDVIVGAEENKKTTFGYGDIVYVRIGARQSVNVGDKYLISAVLGKVKHPVTGDRYGRLIRGLGILQITANDPSADVLTAKIVLSFNSMERGNLLTPYQEPALVYPSSEKKVKDIAGYILEVTDRHTISGQTDFVYIDKGSADGVDPGDRFSVFTEPQERGFPKVKIGEVQVFLVKERSSTAIVRKSSDTLTRGNAITFLQ